MAIVVSSTSRSNTLNALPSPASNRRSAVSATATTTLSPKRSTACSRPRSSTTEAHGAASRLSSSPPSNGSTGSTPVVSSSRSATSRLPRRKPPTTLSLRQPRWLRRTQTNLPPGNPARFIIPKREAPLPGVGPPFVHRVVAIAPSIDRAVEPAARRELPFRLGRQIVAEPARVGERVLGGDVDHGVVASAVDRAAATLRMSPIGARQITPPLGNVGPVKNVLGLGEHHRTGHRQLGRKARML